MGQLCQLQPNQAVWVFESYLVAVDCTNDYHKGHIDLHQVEELPPLAHKEGTYFDSVAEIEVPDFGQIGRAAQLHCIDRLNHIDRRHPVVLDMENLHVEFVRWFVRVAVAFGHRQHRSRVVGQSCRDSRPDSLDSRQSMHSRLLPERGMNLENSRNLLAMVPKRLWPIFSLCRLPLVE